jgi:hypothetical protein
MTRLRTRPITWPMLLAVAAIAVEFSVSANLLTWVGVPYVTEGGSLPMKIHPGTYLLCAAFVVKVGSQDRPNKTVWVLAGGDGKLAVYFGCLATCLVFMALTTGTGNVVVLLDTFLPAGMLACIVRDATCEELSLLQGVFRCGVCINGLIALGEAAAHATLMPLYLNGSEYHAIDGEFRPTALYDHPLTGGVMTLMGLAQAPRARFWRTLYVALASAALIAFGGRVAVAAALASVAFLAGKTFIVRVLRRDRMALRLLLTYGVSAAVCLAMTAIACEAGFGERLLRHLYWDPSAQVRLAQWSLLSELTRWQVLFGTPRDDLLALLTPLWLQSGVEVIENFWLLMFVNLGVVGFPIFLVGLLTLLAWCWQRTGVRGRLLLLSVLVVVSTSNSLGRKSTLLVGLVAAIGCLPEWRATTTGKMRASVSSPTNAILVSSHI